MNRREFLGTAGATAVAANAVLAGDSNSSVTNDPFALIKAMLEDTATPLKWVFTGDSITHGAVHTMGMRSYVEHFAERVRWEKRRLLDIIINTGISGDTMKGITSRQDWRIFNLSPDIVSLKIGMNDCRDGEKGVGPFKESLEALIQKASSQRALLILNTPNLIDYDKDKARTALPLYVNALREVAAKRNIPLVDHYANWEKLTANSNARLHMWLNDGSIHPNGYGHLVLARKLFEDLGIADAGSMVGGKLFVP